MMRNKFPVDTVPLEVLAQLSVDNVAGELSSFVVTLSRNTSQLDGTKIIHLKTCIEYCGRMSFLKRRLVN